MKTRKKIICIFLLLFPCAMYSQNDLYEYKSFGDKYSVKTTLQKYEYKQFEPVVAKFTLVNNDIEPMMIYDLFRPEFKETHIKISDDKGNVWTSNKNPLDFSVAHIEPNYVIQSEDTFIVSMPINNWGEKSEVRSKKDKDWYFGNFGYFPSNRKYKAQFYFNAENEKDYGTTLESNIVEFEVSDLNDEDIEILKLHKEGKQDEIINKYPDNVFTEHVAANNLPYKYWKENSSITNAIIEKEYNTFFENYPNSLYLLNGRILMPYIRALKKDKVSKNDAVNSVNNELVRTCIKWNYKK